MNLSDRFHRQETEDVIIIGEMIEGFMKSDMGRILKLMINNLKFMEVSNSRHGSVNSDKILGRLEAYDTLLSDLEGFIEKKNELQVPINYENPVTDIAHEQTERIRGGEI